MKHTLIFWVCSVSAVGLFVGGFFVPPAGIIDGSVITCGGILFGFAALSQIRPIIEAAGTAKIQHGNMTIEVQGKGKNIQNKNNETGS